MNHLGEYWWITLLYLVVIVVAGFVYTWKIRSLRDVCDISRERIDSMQKILDAQKSTILDQNQEIDQLQQENTKLKKIVDDQCVSQTMMILPPTVVDYRPKRITAELTVPLKPDRVSEGGIRIELVKRLTPEIQKCWSVATEDDVVGNVRHYRATLHVLSR